MKILFIAICFVVSPFANAQQFTLSDFLTENDSLDKFVDSVFNTMDEKSIVAQLLMPAVGRLGSPEDSIKSQIKNNRIGGVLLLNGTVDQFKGWTAEYEAMNKEYGNLPFLYSADAEPSLVNRKMLGSTPVPKANEIMSTMELQATAKTISNDLNKVGINYNFAPVVDVSSNKTVGYRGFGVTPKNIIPFSQEFIKITQEQNIIATAKHFPGHGLVSGDTHASLQVIDGELKELHNYPPLIEDGVLSIMVAHIAVRNNHNFNTQGLPATISETIIQNLLRDSLNFNGLIVTDAMNMGGVSKIQDAAIKAIDAGCDIILMPLNTSQTHIDILKKYREEQVFQEKVNKASKRVIRIKICLGLIEPN